MKTKTQQTIGIAIVVGFIEWVTIPIALGWSKNPLTFSEKTTKIAFSLIAVIVPILGYCLIKWETTND